MPRTKEELKDILTHALGEISTGLWPKEEAASFVDRFAQEIAEQHVLEATATTEAKRQEHRGNIQDLLAEMHSEAVTQYIKRFGVGKHAFIGALKAFISILINAVLVS